MNYETLLRWIPGPDGLPTNILKQGGHHPRRQLHKKSDKIWLPPQECKDFNIGTNYKRIGDKSTGGKSYVILRLSVPEKILSRIILSCVLAASQQSSPSPVNVGVKLARVCLYDYQPVPALQSFSIGHMIVYESSSAYNWHLQYKIKTTIFIVQKLQYADDCSFLAHYYNYAIYFWC